MTGGLLRASARAGRAWRAVPALLAALSGCVPGEPACPVAGQRPMLVAELYFGTAVSGRAPVDATEWADFLAVSVTPAFPEGFTSWDASGGWLDPRSGRSVREPSKVLLLAVTSAPDVPARLEAVMAAWRTRFGQQSVGLVTATACARF